MSGTLWATAAIVVGLAVFEVAMQPSNAERAELALIFVALGVAMAGTARWLPRVARQYRSIRATVAVLSLAAFSIVVVGAVAVGNRMFLSAHDLTLLLVVISFGVVAAVGFALSVSRPLTHDLDRLSESATRVAAGYLEQDLTLDRRDEVGRLSRALDRMVDQLESAEEARAADNAARREFFAAVGHDLRTPLASMRAAIESVRDGVAEDPEAQLETIERNIAILTNLVEDIYLLARLDSGAAVSEAEPVDVTEVADETLEIMGPLAAHHSVEVRLSTDDRFIADGSPQSVGRVLRNLVDNAIRHSPEASVVEVSIEQVHDRVVVTVVDQGPGFDPGFESAAFDRFSRFEPWRSRDTGGSGLGLAIARSLVEAMGGAINIVPGGGGRISFDLPASPSSLLLSRSPVARPAPPGPAAPRRSTASRHRA